MLLTIPLALRVVTRPAPELRQPVRADGDHGRQRPAPPAGRAAAGRRRTRRAGRRGRRAGGQPLHRAERASPVHSRGAAGGPRLAGTTNGPVRQSIAEPPRGAGPGRPARGSRRSAPAGPDAVDERRPTTASKSGCSRSAASVVSVTSRRPASMNSSAQMALPSSREVGLVDDGRVELPRGVPEQAERTHAAGVVPDAGRDDAARAGSRGASRRCRATGSVMKWTTSWAQRDVDDVVARTGGPRPSPRRTSTPG